MIEKNDFQTLQTIINRTVVGFTSKDIDYSTPATAIIVPNERLIKFSGIITTIQFKKGLAGEMFGFVPEIQFEKGLVIEMFGFAKGVLNEITSRMMLYEISKIITIDKQWYVSHQSLMRRKFHIGLQTDRQLPYFKISDLDTITLDTIVWYTTYTGISDDYKIETSEWKQTALKDAIEIGNNIVSGQVTTIGE
jgi:hypothetical protein